MSQQINLCNPALRPRREPVRLDTVAAALAMTLLALGGVHFYHQENVTGLAAELASAERVLQSQQNYVRRLKGDTGKGGDDALAAEVARLEAELRGARQSVEALQGGAIGNQSGYSAYLSAFSRQAVNGLWLTGFVIAANELTLRGGVLHADLIPAFVERLKREKVLQGRNFAALEIHRPPPVEPKKTPDAEKARAPRFLEFTMTSAEPAPAASSTPERRP